MATWPFWIGGIALLAAGLALLAWALLGDRLRGGRKRRRCPRCWYDMTGVPGLMCPECGRAAEEDRRLYRSRRRWRWAVAAAVILVVGVSLIATPGVRAHGWKSLAPTTGVILLLPWMEDNPRWYRDLMHERVGTGPIPRWQRRLLFSRCDAVLRGDASTEFKLRALRIIESVSWRGGWQGKLTGEAGDAQPVVVRAMRDENPSIRGFAAGLVGTIGGDPGVAVAALTTVMGEDENGGVRRSATGSLFHLAEHAAPATAAILAASEFEGTPYLNRDAIYLLGHLPPETAVLSLPRLLGALVSPENEMRYAAAVSLGRLGPAAAGAVAKLAESIASDPDFAVRREAVSALAAIGVRDNGAVEALHRALEDPEEQVQSSAFVALEALSDGDATYVERLWAWLDAQDSMIASGAIRLLAIRGADISPYARWLVPRLRPESSRHWSERMETAKMLCECGYMGREALCPARALVDGEDNDRVRVWAEVLVAQIEGDRTLAVPALIEIIGRYTPPKGPNIRGDAAEALALIGPGAEAALPTLEAMLGDAAGAPREQAKRAIHAITGEPLSGRLAPSGDPAPERDPVRMQ